MTLTRVTCLFFSFLTAFAFSAEVRTNEVLIIATAGSVQTARAGAENWTQAQTNSTLKVGDRLRTGRASRATVRMSDLSILRVAELSFLEVQPPDRPTYPSVLDIKAGAAYFFNRDRPGSVRFKTPTVSGAIRGTEFLIEVAEDGATTVALLDGLVELENKEGQLLLESGQQALVEPGKPPLKTEGIIAKNRLQWTLYYPAVIDPSEFQVEASEAGALASYRNGNLLAALNKLPAQKTNSLFHSALLLAVGKVQEPLADHPAIRRLLAAVQNEQLTNVPPPSTASEWLAESYYQQSQLDLEKARHAAREAVALSPEFGFAHARLAEMEFGFGQTKDAQRHIRKAIELSPENAQAHATHGFILAGLERYDDAARAFQESLSIDSHLPTAWLGRGLLLFRGGSADAGRISLQTAAALEPNRAFYRSYLGKGWSNSREPALARKELDLAKLLDPTDPTSWLYSALLHHQQNEINAAIANLERSKELNNNRTLFRSSFLLDEDQAVRSANLASIYKDAGMREVSVREASYAVNSDYANYSAHLFLANSYDFLRDPRRINFRYETPWLTELIVANLLAPVGSVPLSKNVSQQEYSRLFEGNKLGLISRTEYFSSGEWIQSGSHYGHLGKISYSIDGEYRSDPGWRENQDFEEKVITGKFKFALTPQDEIFIQAITSEFEGGDLFQYYNSQTMSQRGQRVRETQEPILLAGYHRQWAPGIHTLFLGGRLHDDFRLSDTNAGIGTLALNPAGRPVSFVPRPFSFNYQRDLEIWTAELQQIFQTGQHTMVAGARYQDGTVSPVAQLQRPPRSFPPIYSTPASFNDFDASYERIGGYLYHTWQIIEPLHLTAGVTYDKVEHPLNTDLPPLGQQQDEKSAWSPKAGIQYRPNEWTTLRGLYTRSMGGLFFDNSVRLEPTQIAGFNQAFRSIIPETLGGQIAAAEFESAGLGWDQRFPSRTYLTLETELLRSEGERHIGIFRFQPRPPAPAQPAAGSFMSESLDYEEQTATIILNQLLGQNWSLGAQYRWSDSRLDGQFSGVGGLAPDRQLRASLHTVRLQANYNHRCGFFSSAEGIFNAQDLRGDLRVFEDDAFWQFNIYAGYRFWQRRAEVRLGLLNLTDTDYNLHPLTLYQELPHERLLTASVRFTF